MKTQARTGDLGIGICCCHKSCISMIGPIITGSYDTFVNGKRAARLTDLVLGYCGHVGILVTSSNTCSINNLGAVRIGDTFVGCFTGRISIITSPLANTYTGD